MKNESLLVASMRHDFLQLGIRQAGLQLVLQDGLAFRGGKFGEKSTFPASKCVFPGFSFAQEKAQRRQPGEMAIEHLFQRRAGLRGIQTANRRRQLVGQDQTVRDELPGKRKGVVEARVALLILECENDRERRSDDRQDRCRHRQKIPVRDLKQQRDEQRPANQAAGLPSRPTEKLDEFVLPTDVHDSGVPVSYCHAQGTPFQRHDPLFEHDLIRKSVPTFRDNARSPSSTPCAAPRRCGASIPASRRSGRCRRSPPAR